jgi:cytochrome c553
VQCHGPDGGGDPASLAPAIAGLDEWYLKAQLAKFRSGARGTHPDDLAGMRMRPMSLSLQDDEEIAAVAAYVASLPPVPPAGTLQGGDAARGQALYAPCAACHGPDGAGIQPLNGAPLRGSNDWYLLRQMHNFRTGIRGTNPKDASGALMRPMSMTLADEQAILDVIAYITTLSGSAGAR